MCCAVLVPAGEQLYDNNGGQDFVYKTAAGITWEEWAAAALERQEEQEKERHVAEEVRSMRQGGVPGVTGVTPAGGGGAAWMCKEALELERQKAEQRGQ